jgi:hypothetical protein
MLCPLKKFLKNEWILCPVGTKATKVFVIKNVMESSKNVKSRKFGNS